MKIKGYLQFITERNHFQFNGIIDYTLLEESATREEIIELCKKADMLGVKSVCVLPKHVRLAADQLNNSKVLVCTVVSFPEGIDTVEQKVAETQKVISDGADEVDMVLNYNYLQANAHLDTTPLIEEVSSLVNICHQNSSKEGKPIILKVIVESGLLSLEETKLATEICAEAGADFIKTSTGKVKVGAELDKIKVMFDTIREVGSNMKIKASGGIRGAEQINSMSDMVDRFGMGWGAVDNLNGLQSELASSY